MFRRLYVAHFINTFGSWMTFLAIALVTQERYGTQYVAWVFLVQTLPTILFTRSFARLVPVGRQEQVFAITQVLLAANSLVLLWDVSLPAIFMHLIFASLFRSISNPLFNSLVGKWVERPQQQEVFTRLGALQSGTLALAPIAGVWLKMTTSVSMLFALDAASFCLSLFLLKELFVPISGDRKFNFAWRSLFAEVTSRPSNLSQSASRALVAWFVFLGVGALLNAIEFPGFQHFQLNEKQIGHTLAAWGAGSLIAFLFPINMRKYYSSALFALALAIFVFAGTPFWVIFSFFAAGIMSSYISGSLRADIQAAVPAGEHSVRTWAYANQITQLINLIAYAGSGFLIANLGFYPFGVVMLLFAGLLAMYCFREHRVLKPSIVQD